MSIVLSDGNTADPDKWIATQIARGRAWWNRRRAEQIQRKFGGTWLQDWRRVCQSEVITPSRPAAMRDTRG